MSNITLVHQVCQENVFDGDMVNCAGLTVDPSTAGHEIIRQGRKDLVLARATPDLIYEQLVAAGCARKVIFSYMGNPGVGSSRIVRAEIEAGRLEWEEYSHFGMISRLQAGASGLPFIPMNHRSRRPGKGQSELSYGERSVFRRRSCLWSRLLHPDVAIVHVQRCDSQGNAQIWGILGEQKEAAFAARRVILTAEEIVDEAIIRSDPNRTLIPGFIVSAVCHVPYCSHPSYTQGYYDRDNEFYLEWDKISQDRGTTSEVSR